MVMTVPTEATDVADIETLKALVMVNSCGGGLIN